MLTHHQVISTIFSPTHPFFLAKNSPLFNGQQPRKDNTTIITKKRKRLNKDMIITNHMIQTDQTSPLHKCKGCPFNNPQIRNQYKDQQQCISEQLLNKSINILVQKSTISSCQPNIEGSQLPRYINRLRSTPTGIGKALSNLSIYPSNSLLFPQYTWTPYP